MMPRDRVTAKPLIGPVPKKNRARAVIRVVTWESTMVQKALPYPASTPERTDLPSGKFFAHPLVDEDVGVHRHADGEDDAGDAGQGQGGAEHGQPGKEQEDVQHHGDVGDEPGEPVINDHEDHHHDGAEEAGRQPLVDGILAKAGADGHVLDDIDRRGQGADPQDDGQVGRLLVAETAGDLGGAAEDLFPDDRGRADHLIEDDGQPLPTFFSVIWAKTLPPWPVRSRLT